MSTHAHPSQPTPPIRYLPLQIPFDPAITFTSISQVQNQLVDTFEYIATAGYSRPHFRGTCESITNRLEHLHITLVRGEQDFSSQNIPVGVHRLRELRIMLEWVDQTKREIEGVEAAEEGEFDAVLEDTRRLRVEMLKFGRRMVVEQGIVDE